MDIVSGENTGFFIQYSGNDIRVSLLSRFLLVALLYFNFFELSFFFCSFSYTLFYWNEETKEVYGTMI